MCNCSVGHINAWTFYVFDFSAWEMSQLLTIFHSVPEILCLDLNFNFGKFSYGSHEICVEDRALFHQGL